MQLSESEARSYRNDFADRCCRDVADKDYVAARASYRFGIVEPFLWSALQATEKYLKATLLYNGVSTIGVKHDLVEAFERVVGLEGIGSDFPDRVREFLTYLKRHASSRYLERPYFTIGDELMRLVVGGTARWDL